jgi:HEAT repeats/Putative zinc-finger
MICERVREQIPECLAGSLDHAARERLVAHLETCPACRAELAELNAVWRAMGSLPEPEPDPAMRARFREVLEAYQAGLSSGLGRQAEGPGRGPFRLPHKSWWAARPAWQAVLSFALLMVGVFLGRYVAQPRGPSPDVAQLQGQVESLRQLVTLSLLQEQSPSSRLRGVTYSYQMAQPDAQVEQALLYAVNHDSNVNVRLSAVDALEKYTAHPQVRRALADAFPAQDSPLVQIALIDLLVQVNDKEAAPALRKLAQDARADNQVRQHAAWAIQRMEVSQ